MFDEQFIAEINKINTALEQKHGVKKIDKVQRRIGRVIERYPSAAKFYQIHVKSKDDKAT